MNFARNFVTLRRKKNITQEQMAEQCCVSRSAIAKWESGSSVPDLYKLKDIIKIFNVTVDELLYKKMEDSEYIFNNDGATLIENKLDEVKQEIIAEIRKRDKSTSAFALYSRYMNENAEDRVPIEAYAYWGNEEAFKGNYTEAVEYYEEAVIRGDVNSVFAIYEEIIDKYAYDHNMIAILQTRLEQAGKMQQYGRIMEEVIPNLLKLEEHKI